MNLGTCSCGGYTAEKAALHTRECLNRSGHCDVSMMSSFDLQTLDERGVSIRAVVVLDSPLRGVHYVAPPAMDPLLRAIGRRWYSLRDGLPAVELDVLAKVLDARRQDDLAGALAFAAAVKSGEAPLTKGGTVAHEVAFWQEVCVEVLEAFGEVQCAGTLRTLGKQPGSWSKGASTRKGR